MQNQRRLGARWGVVGWAMAACGLALGLPAHAALLPGDLAIIGVHTTKPDEVSFVVLVDVPAGEVVHFTDNNWVEGQGLASNERTESWTSAGVTAGTVVKLSLGGLSSGGDSVIAYQGTASSPTPLFAVATFSKAWGGDTSQTSFSDLPVGLVDGLTAVAAGRGSGFGLGNEWGNVRYDGPVEGTAAELLAQIADANNWAGQSGRFADAAFPQSGDEFDIEAVPEPVALALCGLGGAMLLGRRKRAEALA